MRVDTTNMNDDTKMSNKKGEKIQYKTHYIKPIIPTVSMNLFLSRAANVVQEHSVLFY